jgi:hypothetical protein
VILAKETFGAVVVEKNSFVVLEIEKEVPYSNPLLWAIDETPC